MRAAVTLDECAAVCRARLEGHQSSMQRAPGTENRLAFTIREPIGVVLAISAFNHPLNLVCHQAGDCARRRQRLPAQARVEHADQRDPALSG